MAPTIQRFINTFNNALEPPVQQHLKNVYACLAISTIASAFGASLHLFTNIIQAGFLPAIGSLICLCLLMATHDDNGKNVTLRMGYLMGFTTFTGVGIGPLLEHVIALNPAIIITALIGTSVVFASFSIAAALAPRGKWLYLGGPLIATLTTMMILSIANLFFGSSFLFHAQLYLGLVLMCGFVLYDTQLIIEKRRLGSKDFVAHSLDLFVDFVGIFRRILIILTEKEHAEQQRRRK